MKKFICALTSTALCAAALAGCGSPTVGNGGADDTVRTEAGAAYTLSVPSEPISAVKYSDITLPAPTAKDGADNDLSEFVRVKVMYEDGSIYVPEHRYGLYPSFSAYAVGTYYAVYTVDHDGATVAKSVVRVDVTDDPPSDDIVVDGVLNDEKYALAPEYRTGIDNKLLFKYYFGEDGMYIGVDVEDDNLVYSDYIVSRLTQSDGFEVYLNLSDERSEVLNSKCFKIQVGMGGEVIMYSASTGGTFYERNERLMPEYRLQLHGTRSVVGSNSLASFDTDDGYTFEMYIGYDQLGLDGAPEKAGVAFAHRDITDASGNAIAMGGMSNLYYSDVQLPDALAQILSANGNNYQLEWYEAAAFTSLYNNLYIGGERNGVAVPQTAPANTDGVWANKTAVEFTAKSVTGEDVAVTAKAFTDERGLYARITVNDRSITSRNTTDIFNGDCVQLRVAVGDTTRSSSLPKGIGILDKIFTVCPTGKTEKSYLNAESITFRGGYDCSYSVTVSEGVSYTVEIFVPAYELGLSANTPVAVCFGVLDSDDSTYLTTANDMTFSCDKTDPSRYTPVGGTK